GRVAVQHAETLDHAGAGLSVQEQERAVRIHHAGMAVDAARERAVFAAHGDGPAVEADVAVAGAGVRSVGDDDGIAATHRGVDRGLDGALGAIRRGAHGAGAGPGVVAAECDVDGVGAERRCARGTYAYDEGDNRLVHDMFLSYWAASVRR